MNPQQVIHELMEVDADYWRGLLQKYFTDDLVTIVGSPSIELQAKWVDNLFLSYLFFLRFRLLALNAVHFHVSYVRVLQKFFIFAIKRSMRIKCAIGIITLLCQIDKKYLEVATELKLRVLLVTSVIRDLSCF